MNSLKPLLPVIPAMPFSRVVPEIETVCQPKEKVAIAIRDPLESSHVEWVLSQDGYEVIPFDSASRLWKTFPYQRPRIVVTDRKFNSEFNGLDLCRRIREEYPSPYVYLIVLSHMNHVPEIEACLENGANDYVIKPYSPLHLRSHLLVARRWLRLLDLLPTRKSVARRSSVPLIPPLPVPAKL